MAVHSTAGFASRPTTRAGRVIRARCWGSQGVGGSHRPRRSDRFRLRGEILPWVDELILLESVLLVVQLAVATIAGEQLVVGALFDDLAVFQHENLIRASDR